MNIKKVKMYTQPNCSFCLSAEALCDTRNIQIEQKIDIAESVRNKSNMVPIFADKKEDAKDIASMRR